MKSIISFSLLIMLFGCATVQMNSGKYFDSAKVSDIKKNITAKTDIEKLFGVPFAKKVSDNDEETWNYYYTSSKTEAQSFLFTTNVNMDGVTKMLSITFKNDIVTSYNYSETPIKSSAY
jgi:hypothetical protein